MDSSAAAGTRHRKELLLHKLARLARERPHDVYAQYPRAPTTYAEGFRDVSYAALANAVDGTARWFTDQLGPGGDRHEPVAYIGPNDVRYPALVLGANKAGYKLFLPSPRNAPAAQWSLLKTLDCRVLLTSSPQPPAIVAIREAQLQEPDHRLHVIEVPTVDELLGQAYAPFPYTKSFEQGRRDPLVVLHTSGTTGLPKPIIWTQEYAATLGRQLQLPPPAGYESNELLYQGNRVFAFFPPFHAAYHAHSLVNALTNETCYIFPLPAAIPSAQGLADALEQTRIDVAFVVPLTIEEMSKDDRLLDHISTHLNVLVYAGGDVPDVCGNKVAAKVKLMNYYGATEIGSVVNIRPQGSWDRENWRYITFHPETGMDFRPHTGDMHELYIVRLAEQVENQPIFNLFPGLQEYRTQDLWMRHPTISNAWHHCGRADDIIVFLNGEKTNPVTMEQHICAANAQVSAALVVGAKRFQAALIVEPKDNTDMSATERATLLQKIWPSIEEANQACPAHAKISQSLVLFTKPDKPMLRTPKGTVRRRQTTEVYARELNNLYKDAELASIVPNSRAAVDVADPSALETLIRHSVSKVSGIQPENDQDLFEKGMDSLQALLLVRELRSALRLVHLSVPVLYANPSVSQLVRAITEVTNDQRRAADKAQAEKQAELVGTLARYLPRIEQVPKVANATAAQHVEERVVILTGSTGTLGSYLLDSLLRDRGISHIYCLNRSADASSIQVALAQKLHLNCDFGDRLTFAQADLSHETLGLSEAIYTEISQNATTVIHNAYPVNFNLSLASFRPQLESAIQIVRLVAAAARHPRLLFVSSVGSVQSIPGVVHEEIIADVAAPGQTGYAESKYLCERLFAHAADTLGVPVCIARVGQIAGPSRGPSHWNRHEWLPSLIVSSAHLKAIPDSLPTNLDVVDWLPADEVANILVDLSVTDAPYVTKSTGDIAASAPAIPARVVHLCNPHTVRWATLVPEVVRAMAAAREPPAPEAVPFEVWIRRVQDDLEGGSDTLPLSFEAGGQALADKLEANPAAKLLTFFQQQMEVRSRAELEMRVAQSLSSRLSEIGPVQNEWMHRWVQGCLQ